MKPPRRASLEQKGVRALLLDVEGTTTSVEFVYGILFPYARARMGDYLRAHGADPEVHGFVEDLRREHDRAAGNPPDWNLNEPAASAEAYALWLMDRDRKSTPLKELQGRIWEAAYRCGDVRGHVFGDVGRAFRRWMDAEAEVYIFSSGSVRAQRLLFRYSEAGDLTRYLCGHFDTTVGTKKEAESYKKIAAECGLEPSAMLFVSDSPDELDAAAEAGLRTLASVRPGNAATAEAIRHPVIATFDDIESVI